MLIQPRYRAQAINGYTFQALFGVADPNIRFRKTFTVEFDIGDFNLGGIRPRLRRSPDRDARSSRRPVAFQSVGHRDRGVREVRERWGAEGNRQE